VASNPSRSNVIEEENLLIEAVSLLLQRQRETESVLAESRQQLDGIDRRHAEFEARLASIEDRLARLARELGSSRTDAAAGERLARLREHLAELKSDGDPRPRRPLRPPEVTSLDAARRQPEAQRAASGTGASLPSSAPDAVVPTPEATRGPTLWNIVGATPRDRFGLLLIGVGVIAVLYAVLSMLHFP
jgi:hypothetical protein